MKNIATLSFSIDIHCTSNSLGPDAAGIIHAPFRARARATAQPRLKSYRFSPLKMFPMRQEKTTRGGLDCRQGVICPQSSITPPTRGHI